MLLGERRITMMVSLAVALQLGASSALRFANRASC